MHVRTYVHALLHVHSDVCARAWTILFAVYLQHKGVWLSLGMQQLRKDVHNLCQLLVKRINMLARSTCIPPLGLDPHTAVNTWHTSVRGGGGVNVKEAVSSN